MNWFGIDSRPILRLTDLLVFSLSITLKGFDYQLEVQQDNVKCLEHMPIVISKEILILKKEWLL